MAVKSPYPTITELLDFYREKGDIPILHWYDLIKIPNSPYLVKNFLNAGNVSVFYGEPGSMKSFALIDLGMHIALGKSWCGRKVQPGPVLYVCGEGIASLQKRIVAFNLKNNINVDFSVFDDDLIDPIDIPFHVLPVSIDFTDPNGAVQSLIKTAKALPEPFVLIIIDTLSRAMAAGDENDSKAMGALVKTIDSLRQQTGAHVALVHHTGKDPERGPRGHSLLKGAIDTEVRVTRHNDLVLLETTKQRDLPLDFKQSFSFESIWVGLDEDNQKETSLVLIPTNRAPSVEVTGKPLIALQALRDAVRKEGEEGHTPGSKAIPIERWRSICDALPLAKGTKKALYRAFDRAKEHLLEKGVVFVQDGWVWPKEDDEVFVSPG